MQKKTIFVAIAVVAVSLLIIFVFFGGKTSAPSTNQTSTTSAVPNTENAGAVKSFSLSDVAVNNKKTDCWTIVDGQVYDITSYVPRHPGGEEILRACGTDGTSLFTKRTTKDGEKVGSGTPHSGSAPSQLESLKVGVLTQ